MLAEKRELYLEYNSAHDEMRELPTVKADINRILNIEKRWKPKENYRRPTESSL